MELITPNSLRIDNLAYKQYNDQTRCAAINSWSYPCLTASRNQIDQPWVTKYALGIQLMQDLTICLVVY